MVLCLVLISLCRAAPLQADDPARIDDGAAITPEFARALFDRVRVLREPDGCRVEQFNTERFRIAIGLQAPSGTVHTFGLSSARPRAGARSAGEWALAVPDEIQTDCPQTLAAIEGIVGVTAAPRGTFALSTASTVIYQVLAAAFVVLLVGSVLVLWRELRAQRPPRGPVLALAAVSLAALIVRWFVSPWTFLHEYYHIAITVPAYFTGVMPLYGNTGPALFRMMAAILGRQDVDVIFLTSVLISSLAVPALALLDLALFGQWPRAVVGAVVLAVLPLHLRFSAAEDLFVLAVTFGLWTLALFALYLRSGRTADALLCALALALAMQVRPEMLIFPAVVLALMLLHRPRSWRVLFAWRTWLAAALVLTLMVPRLFELPAVLGASTAHSTPPDVQRYLSHLMLLQPEVTPRLHLIMLAFGALWGIRRAPGLVLWAASTFLVYTVAALTLFDNPPYNLRSQLLPTSLVMIVAAGAGPLWMACWGEARRQQAVRIGTLALAAFAAFVLITSHGFVTELRDQQLEWAFLERTVPQLPERGTLLTAVDAGGNNLDGFPLFLLTASQKSYDFVDVRRLAKREAAWPDPDAETIFYHGMFCYFALEADATVNPMTDFCQAVHERYTLEPLFVETLHTQGYSHLYYAEPPYRIGFYRLRQHSKSDS